MHLFGANLDLERLEIRSNDRSVQRLVEIVARRGNPVFDAAGNRLPVVMDHSQRGVTMAHFVRSNDSRGDEIVDLVETNLLRAQFFPDRVETLDASFDE